MAAWRFSVAGRRAFSRTVSPRLTCVGNQGPPSYGWRPRLGTQAIPASFPAALGFRPEEGQVILGRGPYLRKDRLQRVSPDLIALRRKVQPVSDIP